MPSPRKRRVRRALAEVVGANTDLAANQKADAFVNNLAALSAYRSVAPSDSRPFLNGDKTSIRSDLDDLLFGAGGEAGVSTKASLVMTVLEGTKADWDSGYFTITSADGATKYAFQFNKDGGATDGGEIQDIGGAGANWAEVHADLKTGPGDGNARAAGIDKIIHTLIGGDTKAQVASAIKDVLNVAAIKTALGLEAPLLGNAAGATGIMQPDLTNESVFIRQSSGGKAGNVTVTAKIPNKGGTPDKLKLNGVTVKAENALGTSAFHGGGELSGVAPSGGAHARHLFDSRATVQAGSLNAGHWAAIAATKHITDTEGVLYSSDGPYAKSVGAYDPIIKTAGHHGAIRILPTGWAAGKALQLQLAYDLCTAGNNDTIAVKILKTDGSVLAFAGMIWVLR